MSTFAAHTKVSSNQTLADIQATLARYGAENFSNYTIEDQAVIFFNANGRYLRFNLPLPTRAKLGNKWDWGDQDDWDFQDQAQEVRSRWRALLLCIKAKLQSIESGIETFEEAFLSHIIDDDGITIGEKVIAALPPPRTGNNSCV